MDVFDYRRIILNNLQNCTPILQPIQYDLIQRGVLFYSK
jgi:hypothetical protein